VINLAASSEGGRALLGGVVESGLLSSMMKSPSSVVRASAASAMTKLGLSAKVGCNRALQGLRIKSANLRLNICCTMFFVSGFEARVKRNDSAVEYCCGSAQTIPEVKG